MLGGYRISIAKQPVNIRIRNDMLRNEISNLSEIILLILDNLTIQTAMEFLSVVQKSELKTLSDERGVALDSKGNINY